MPCGFLKTLNSFTRSLQPLVGVVKKSAKERCDCMARDRCALRITMGSFTAFISGTFTPRKLSS